MAELSRVIEWCKRRLCEEPVQAVAYALEEIRKRDEMPARTPTAPTPRPFGGFGEAPREVTPPIKPGEIIGNPTPRESPTLITAMQHVTPNPTRVTCTIGPVSLPDVLVADGDAWLTQAEIAALFGVHKETVREHICGILEEGECKPDATTRNFLAVRSEGSRQVQRDVTHYSSDMVLAIGYRVRSSRGVEFRQWVTRVIKGEVEAPAPKAALTRMPNGEDVMRLVSIVETLSSKVEELSSKQLPASAYESIVESAVADRFDTLEARLAKLEAPKPTPALPPITLVRPQTKPRFAGWFSAQAAKRGILRKDCGKLFQRVYAQLAAEYGFDVYAMRKGDEPLWSVALVGGYEDELHECAETVLAGLDRASAAE